MKHNINIIKNYIGKDTCNFINLALEDHLMPTPNESILGGPSGWIGEHRYSHNLSSIDKNSMNWPNKIFNYRENSDYNITIDLLSLILNGMTKTVSDHYGEEYVMRSFFYGAMLPGAKNTLHMDNHYLHSDTNMITERINSGWDKSGILYFNEEYTGGNIFFPLQNLSLKPDAGTFIFFEGNEDNPHEVQEVKTGIRKNLIVFFIRKDKVHNIMGWDNPDAGLDGPEIPLTLDYLYKMNKDLI